ncbi:hypothetical protein AUJ77_02735 [Candidatus Nomurabacteria bacterium CG1_02_43_90]|uniref:Uncharacterized protein n=1 Tax=Candidatus Nomurabacteria bacterium CG1_02_43_90 TaxID=1805281 RepID=A0A1J4V3Z5_9BACT|nr:MAG: hypothetical protein AUJ77_02735 [Candidatus Nomurabacteria bacterium CG1_02_43_90]
MSITNQKQVQQIFADATDDLAENKKQFKQGLSEIEKEREVVLREAHHALEVYAIAKLREDIQHNGK